MLKKWCCTDGKRQEIPPLIDRIISNFSSLIRDLDSKTVFPDLLKLNLVTEQEVKKERSKQLNKQNRFILIKLINNCGELDKKIKRILYKQPRIHQILRGPRWPKRGKFYFVCRNEFTMQCRGNDTTTKSANASIGNASNECTMQRRGNETITESTNASIGIASNKCTMQCRGNETITESANASIGNASNKCTMQCRRNETITESANASIGNASNECTMQCRGNETNRICKCQDQYS